MQQFLILWLRWHLNFQNCDLVAHYAKNGDNFDFEVEANWNNLEGDVEGKWVGVALGLDGGRGMGNDAAVACFADADGNAHADNYWNVLEYAASPTGFFSLPVAVSNMQLGSE